jgi:hypothetical protein
MSRCRLGWAATRPDLPEVPPAAGKVDDAANTHPVTPDAEPQLSRDDPDPERAEKPTERETPPVTPNTTRIPKTVARQAAASCR